jgi:ATP-binding cassette subfamily F protein 3
MPLLTVSNLGKLYGADQVLRNVTFNVERGERIALVGANGSGKSTLLRLIAGLDEPDEGQISLARNGLVTYVAQHAQFETKHTLWDAMLDAFAPALHAQARMRELESQLGGEGDGGPLHQEYRTLSATAEHAGYDYESRIERVLTGLEFDRSVWSHEVSLLSGGQKTRANLARALLKECDLLLLDEPTNHLDIAAIQWLETYLRSVRQAFIVVAHDRYFLDKVTRRTLELASGTVEDYAAPYMQFLKLREERRARVRIEYERQQEQIAATEAYVQRYGAGQRAKEAQGRQKRLDRVQRLTRPEDEDGIKLRLSKRRQKGGDSVLSVDHLAVGYTGCAIVQGPDELQVSHGARVAIVGPNGSGKTTLARTLIGQLPPVSGSFRWAPGTTPAYYSQTVSDVFNPEHTVLQAFISRHTVTEEVGRTYLGRFLFTGDDVGKLVDTLSGGERSRLALAVLLYSHPTVMLLDEPTNHLDISAREALERALADFGGTLVMVSHDRFLIDRLATEIWSIEGGSLQVYDGNWSDFQAGRYRRNLRFSAPVAPPPVVISSQRPRSEIAADLGQAQSEAAPILKRLTANAPTGSVDDLRALTDSYAETMSRLTLLTEELMAADS